MEQERPTGGGNIHKEGSSTFEHSWQENVFLVVVNSFSSVVGTPANLTILACIFLSSELRCATSFLLASLFITDLLCCAVCQPIFVHALVVGHGSPILETTTFILLLGSVNNMIALTAERFIAVNYPFQYKAWLTERCIAVMSSISFVVALLLALLTTQFGIVPFWFSSCYIALSTAVFVTLYCKIYRTARRHNQQIQHQQPSTDGDHVVQHSAKTTKSIALIMLTFLICWLPYVVAPPVLDRGINNVSFLRVFPWINTLALLNSLVDPFIYFWRFSEFRASALNMLRRQRRNFSCDC